MAGRRLVDAAKLFSASKSVAQKHIALRSNQFEVYNKTSTLAKAVKSQTDRVTLTAAAAIALSQRFSEEAPAYARAAAERATGAQHDNIPRRETVEADVPPDTVKDGLEQDHHYDRSSENSAARPPPDEDLEIAQKEAPRRPMPDGTIPTAELTLEQEEKGQDTFTDRSTSEAPKRPLAEDQTEHTTTEDEGIKPIESTESTIPLPRQPRGASTASQEAIPAHANDFQRPTVSAQVQRLQEGLDRDVFYSRSVESQPATSAVSGSQIPSRTATEQRGDEHVEVSQLNQDVYYSASKSGQESPRAVVGNLEQEEVPEGINTDVFHSRKVARMLGSDRFSRKEHLQKQGTGRHPLDDHRPIPKTEDSPAGRANESTKFASPTPSDPKVQPATTSKEMEDFASQLSQDVQSSIAKASEVSHVASVT